MVEAKIEIPKINIAVVATGAASMTEWAKASKMAKR
jgi:hypothetical protein